MLRNDVEDYVAFADIEKITADGYRRSVRCYSGHLQRAAVRDDLNESSVNRWLASLTGRLSAKTILNRKRGITPVWNWLASRGETQPYNHHMLRRVRVDNKPVSAWSVNDVAALLDAALELPGRLRCGVAVCDLMRAWVLVAYETGFRPSDLRQLTWQHFTDERTIFISQSKTGKPVAKRLSPNAAAAVSTLRESTLDAVFILTKSGMRKYETQLFKLAKTKGFHRKPGQSTGTLRKTHATEVCRAGDAQQAALSLGHVSGPTIALKHYIATDAMQPSDTPRALIDGLQETNRQRDQQRRSRPNEDSAADVA